MSSVEARLTLCGGQKLFSSLVLILFSSLLHLFLLFISFSSPLPSLVMSWQRPGGSLPHFFTALRNRKLSQSSTSTEGRKISGHMTYD